MREANVITGGNHRAPWGEGRRCVRKRSGRRGGTGQGARQARGRVRGRRIVWLLIGLLLVSAFSAPVHAASFQEYQLKAVFLYNFINFVTWPDEAFSAPDRPFTIGILGKNPFGSFLEKVVSRETFKGRPILLKRADALDELADCQILFIGKSNRARLGAILESVSPKHVLTVGDFDGFIQTGGMINLTHADQRVRIEINIQTTRNADLGVSSKLLRVAKVRN